MYNGKYDICIQKIKIHVIFLIEFIIFLTYI